MKRWGVLSSLVVLAGLLTAMALAMEDDFKRERGKENDAEKDSIEGKPPPAMIAKSWMNIGEKEALAWKDLRGKVVVLDFWGVW